MGKMKVTWTEFNQVGYQAASETYPGIADPKDFEHTFTGEVIDSYHTFWGTPRFVVLLDDGNIVCKNMNGCKVIKSKDE
jgi:hypothetical protein